MRQSETLVLIVGLYLMQGAGGVVLENRAERRPVAKGSLQHTSHSKEQCKFKFKHFVLRTGNVITLAKEGDLNSLLDSPTPDGCAFQLNGNDVAVTDKRLTKEIRKSLRWKEKNLSAVDDGWTGVRAGLKSKLWYLAEVDADRQRCTYRQRLTDLHTVLSKDKVAELRHAFSLFDKDKDGTVSINDLGTVMRSLGQTFDERQLREMISAVDRNGDGKIDFVEFLNGVPRKQSSSDEDYVAFRVFDQDGDGLISRHEFRSGMVKIGEALSEEEADDLISGADGDGDGQLSYAEFVKLMTGAK